MHLQLFQKMLVIMRNRVNCNLSSRLNYWNVLTKLRKILISKYIFYFIFKSKFVIVNSSNFYRLSGNLDMEVLHYKNYGRNQIKKFKMSPDSFIQMAIQYAFYRYVNKVD